jgi:hypothetical protein
MIMHVSCRYLIGLARSKCVGHPHSNHVEARGEAGRVAVDAVVPLSERRYPPLLLPPGHLHART